MLKNISFINKRKLVRSTSRSMIWNWSRLIIFQKSSVQKNARNKSTSNFSFVSYFNASQQESVRLAALLAKSLIIKQEKRFLRIHVSVALLSQRLLLKKSSNLSSHDLSKLLANKTKWWNCCQKKVLPFTHFFFC